ncbi:MAG: helix-turn-helix transcriptional regulator, partial [Albidovulum sp.]
AGLSQPELARHLGVRAKTVEQWENDAAEPRANRLQMLAGMLSVSLMWLLTGEGDGVEGPGGGEVQAPEVMALLRELRQLQGEINGMAARLGQVEKRLRQRLLATPQNVEADRRLEPAQ